MTTIKHSAQLRWTALQFPWTRTFGSNLFGCQDIASSNSLILQQTLFICFMDLTEYLFYELLFIRNDFHRSILLSNDILLNDILFHIYPGSDVQRPLF
jgi:hypothetical protein